MFSLFFIEEKTDAFEMTVIVMSNVQKFYILSVCTIFITSLIFAKEIQDRVCIYIFVRPVSLVKLYISKILAIWIYLILMLSTVFIISIITNTIIGKGISIEIIYEKIGYISSYYFMMAVSVLIVINLSAVFSVILKNQLSSILATLLAIMFITFFSYALPDVLFYYTYVPYMELTHIVEYTSDRYNDLFVKGIFIILIYSSIFFFITNSYVKKLKKGV
jgi:ABC-2 type transport system permease protein